MLPDPNYVSFVLKAVDNPDSLLDVGCGNSAITERFGWAVKCTVGVDPRSTPTVLRSSARIRARAEALPFRDGSFDCIHTFESHHLLDWPGSAGQSIRRVLAPSGRLAIGWIEHGWEEKVHPATAKAFARLGLSLISPNLPRAGFHSVTQALPDFRWSRSTYQRQSLANARGIATNVAKMCVLKESGLDPAAIAQLERDLIDTLTEVLGNGELPYLDRLVCNVGSRR